MKTWKQILKEGASDDTDLEFIADQLVNDENSSNKEMIIHLTKETGMDPKVIKKIVNGARDKVLAKPLSSTDKIISIIKKYI